MTTTSPTPRGTRKHSRPLLAATALTALLALSACGSSEDPKPADTASPSTTASASASSSQSASASPTPSASSETAQASEASRAEPEKTQAAPEETRKATSPELTMPTASPFDKEKADAQAAGGGCNASQLSGTAAPEQGAAGHTIVALTLTNKGSAPCTLNGYAGVSFVDASGATVGAPASREGAGAGAVTLQPGATASAGLSITQPGVIGQICNPHVITGLRVYPPGSHESLVVSYPGQACGNPKVSQLQVKGFGS
ncbi:hypothetical protein CWC38_04755 [Kocuria tytonicola]|uniref:DUF4232 domain-containing protein n=1 Tax=Kocuria tytonicola TaxID=2055946 RepID=UPI000EF8EBF7|nr:DUF4232 domain-containing protein [Kocuria tytonicola]RLZ03628.1 hypothetical protein CWC38_04755 [Kocuria tytonicola]